MPPTSALRCLTITLVIGLAAFESQVQAFTIQRQTENENTTLTSANNASIETTVSGTTPISTSTTKVVLTPTNAPSKTNNTETTAQVVTTMYLPTTPDEVTNSDIMKSSVPPNDELKTNNEQKISNEIDEIFLTIAPLVTSTATTTENPKLTTVEADKLLLGYFTSPQEDTDLRKEMITNDEFFITGLDTMYSFLPDWQKTDNKTEEPNISPVTTEPKKITTSKDSSEKTTSVKPKSSSGTFKTISFYHPINSKMLWTKATTSSTAATPSKNTNEEQNPSLSKADENLHSSKLTTTEVNLSSEKSTSETDNVFWKEYKHIERTKIPLVKEIETEDTDTGRFDVVDNNYFKDMVKSELEKEEEISLPQKDETTILPITAEYKTISRNQYANKVTEFEEYKGDNEIPKVNRAANTNDINTRSIQNNTHVMSSQRAGFLNYSSNGNIDDTSMVVTSTDDAAKEKSTKGTTMDDITITTYLTDTKSIEADESDTPSDFESDVSFSTTVFPTPKSTNDNLSVKPISDKSKTTIYTVSPNYKPLKKIEVTPPKHFLRDPDDNSWRNESLSSLGIVFKAKNSSKTFTEVLKNKTETELNALGEKSSKEEPELRTRLEKITELRKSKKKKPDGADCDGKSNECNSTELEKISPKPNAIGLRKPAPDYYEDDEDDSEYVTLANIDIKKYMKSETTEKPNKNSNDRKAMYRNFVVDNLQNSIKSDRKPTVQYFPPRTGQRVNVDDYDEKFVSKMNLFTSTPPPTTTEIFVVTYPTLADYVSELERNKYENRQPVLPEIKMTSPPSPPQFQLQNMKMFVTSGPPLTHNSYKVANNDDSYTKAENVIKHLKELLHYATKSSLDGKLYVVTEPTVEVENARAKFNDESEVSDYMNIPYRDSDKLVDVFNPDNARFKMNFPLLYNTSVIHSKGGKGHASSSTFVRRQYERERRKGHHPVYRSPALGQFGLQGPPQHAELEYEAAYLEPDFEQTEEMEVKADMLPPYLYRYRK